ncbi:HNH endonuclease [Streptomyces albulus]|uniref:HNH endonuclease signature motif containing protein n=1 Tax=Streptomyces noursei TaxID=1971 RepID=UPI001F3F6497|nr:HNH endonuclease signature motif containing protein [Streptomyces noursei]MCE4945858.1 HNH endonuclease [Streptomyces noursei]
MPTSPYTRERLEAAAASSRTLSEALEKLGTDPRSTQRNYLRERMRKLGIDTAHFERDGTKWTREALRTAVANSTNMCEVLRHLGLEVVGGQHTHISRRVRAYGIDTSHFTPVVRTARMRHNRRRRTADEILVQATSAQTNRTPNARLTRALRERGVAEHCALCGIEPVWQGEPLPLEVDHVDGDWRNNRIENLRFLCPNCHSTTDSYRGRGKGRGRGAAV